MSVMTTVAATATGRTFVTCPYPHVPCRLIKRILNVYHIATSKIIWSDSRGRGSHRSVSTVRLFHFAVCAWRNASHKLVEQAMGENRLAPFFTVPCKNFWMFRRGGDCGCHVVV